VALEVYWPHPQNELQPTSQDSIEVTSCLQRHKKMFFLLSNKNLAQSFYLMLAKEKILKISKGGQVI